MQISTGEEVVLDLKLPDSSGTVEVLANVPGSQVLVDGRPAGQAPLAALRLEGGEHIVEVRSEGHQAWTGTVRITGGESTTLRARLAPLRRTGSALRPTFWTTLTLGTAGIASGVTLAVLARRKASDLEKVRGEFGGFPQSIESAGDTYAKASLATLVIGAGPAAAAILLVVDLRERAPASRARQTSWRITPVVEPGGGYGVGASTRVQPWPISHGGPSSSVWWSLWGWVWSRARRWPRIRRPSAPASCSSRAASFTQRGDTRRP